MSMQEAPYSVNFFAQHPVGPKMQFTHRSENSEEFLKQLEQLVSTLLAEGYELSQTTAVSRMPNAPSVPSQSQATHVSGDYNLPTKTLEYIGCMGYHAKSGPSIVFYEAGLKFQSLGVWMEDLPLIQEINNLIDWEHAPKKYGTLEEAMEDGHFVQGPFVLEVEQRNDKDGEPEVNKNGYPIFKISRRAGANAQYRGGAAQEPQAQAQGSATREDTNLDRQRRNLASTARDVYGNKYEDKLTELVEWISNRDGQQTNDETKLSGKQLEELQKGLDDKLAEIIKDQEEIPF